MYQRNLTNTLSKRATSGWLRTSVRSHSALFCVPYQTPLPVHSRIQFSAKMSSAPVFTEKAPTPVGPYSQAFKTGSTIFCSGQVPLKDGKLIEGTIAEQTELCIKNLQAVLEAGGSSLGKVVKTTIFLADMASFKEVNGEYEKWFTHKPARSCVAVKTLPLNAEVEIEAIATL